jgi:hypothetical protein
MNFEATRVTVRTKKRQIQMANITYIFNWR